MSRLASEHLKHLHGVLSSVRTGREFSDQRAPGWQDGGMVMADKRGSMAAFMHDGIETTRQIRS